MSLAGMLTSGVWRVRLQSHAFQPFRRFSHGRTVDPHFMGAGRTVTDAEGRYEFPTIKPGAYPWRTQPAPCVDCGLD